MSSKAKAAEETHELVRKAYGEVAKKQSSCCEPASCCGPTQKAVSEGDLGLSCGDPVAFSQIMPGDVVLDLGSGAGKDVFLAARRIGPSGKAIGVDMTDEMLALAGKNVEKFKASTGLGNVEFRKGRIEALPVKSGEVDVIISNCVINLSQDKAKVF
ncbi:MAG: methyltransferase domain-containing protein, partial [Elusimicrobiota bacterium]